MKYSMKRRVWLVGALAALLWATPAKAAGGGVIVRTTLGLSGLQALCLTNSCTVVPTALDGTLGQVFLVTTLLDPATLASTLGALPGIVDAEVNQLLSLVDLTQLVPTLIPPTLMQDRSSTPYPVGSTTQTAWNSYVNQPAASIVGVQNAQKTFNVLGTGIVADIDTGVDPNHPVLQPVLVPGDGFDFTRNQAGGSEMTDLNASDFQTFPPQSCPTCQPATVNQSTAAVLDQSTAAVLDGNGNPNKYAAFGHGTMVMGIIHLVAPTAQLMPLKAFHSDGTASMSDILSAIYYGVQNGANVINMSFDTKTSSAELQKALDYANSKGVICAASAGNDGMQEIVYPAALQNDVMGVASTSDQDTRSSFSNWGNAIVWVAAPGEAIVTTYPFNTYAAGWGTSFSAPFVSGGAALLHNLQTTIAQSGAATATAHAVPLTDPGMGNGRLDLCMALGSVGTGSCSPDYTVSATPLTQTITAGQQASFTVSATPQNGSKQTVTWSCMVAPPGPSCTVSPQSVTLNGSTASSATATLMTVTRGMATPMILPRGGPSPRLWVTLTAFITGLAVLLIVCGLSRTLPRRPGLAAAAGLLAVSVWTYSCGGYGNSPGPGPGPGSPTLSSVTLNPTSVTGGSSSIGMVTLSGPAPSGGLAVNLSSSSPATVPASVTVAYGASSATFTVTTSAVSASTPVTITASYGGATTTATLTVMPQASSPTLSSLTLNPTSVTGGAQTSTGTVTLSGPAPTGGAQVVLSSNNAAASVPTSVTVAAGATSATFTVTTSAVTASTPATISASYAGVTKTASLTVAPPGTAAGTYTLTITGTSGNLSHSTTVSVIVN
jgi:Subtilase family